MNRYLNRLTAKIVSVNLAYQVAMWPKNTVALLNNFHVFGSVVFFLITSSAIAGSALQKNDSILIDSLLVQNNLLVKVQNLVDSGDIPLANLSSLDEILRSERALRDRFVGKSPAELIEYLAERGFWCGNLGTVGRAEVDMSCRRSRPGSWLPFALAQTTTVMFRGRREQIEIIDLIAKLDGFP
jgi:hypothetical protein